MIDRSIPLHFRDFLSLPICLLWSGTPRTFRYSPGLHPSLYSDTPSCLDTPMHSYIPLDQILLYIQILTCIAYLSVFRYPPYIRILPCIRYFSILRYSTVSDTSLPPDTPLHQILLCNSATHLHQILPSIRYCPASRYSPTFR